LVTLAASGVSADARQVIYPKWSPPPAEEQHDHELALCLAERGVAHGRVDGRQSAARRGQYSIVPAGAPHTNWTEADPAQVFVLHIRASLLAQLADELEIQARPFPPGVFETSELLLLAVSTLKHEMANASFDRAHELLVESLVSAIGVALLRSHFQPRAPGPTATGSTQVAEIADRMRAEPCAPYTLEMLSRCTGMSRFQFLREFKRQLGTPPHAFLTAQRLEKGSRLLRETDLSVTAIAFEVGFGSVGRFTEAFKRRHGATPTVWRSR